MSASQVIKIQDDYFKRGVRISIGAHTILVLFILLNLVFSKKTTLDLSQAIRVDMVGLPDKIDSKKLPDKIKELPVPISKPEAKRLIEKLPEKVKVQPIKPDPNVIDLKKNKNKQKEALEKLKKSSAIDKIKQELKSEDAQNKIHDEANKAIIKGRVVSAGTTLSGLDKIEANTYLQEIDQLVKQQWALPQWLMNKPLKSQVLVKFSSNGQIISRVIMRSSGEPSYDNYCLQAVDQAAPFPKVPEKFTEKFGVDGVVIGFPE